MADKGRKGAASGNGGERIAEDEYLSFFELFARNTAASDPARTGGATGRASAFTDKASPFADPCGSCGVKGDSGACSRCEMQGADPEAQSPAAGEARKEEEPLPELSEEEREAVLAMDYESLTRALQDEHPHAVAVATEFIVHYSLKVAEELRKGDAFQHVVRPVRGMPVVECIAMDIVRSSVTTSLQEEHLAKLGYGA